LESNYIKTLQSESRTKQKIITLPEQEVVYQPYLHSWV